MDFTCAWCGLEGRASGVSGIIHQCQRCYKVWAEGSGGAREVFEENKGGEKWVSISSGVLIVGQEVGI